MAYGVLNVANKFLDLAKQDGISIDPLKLQKLAYLAHGWHLALIGDSLVLEPVEAWRYGPVVRRLYRQFRDFKADSITRKARVPEESEILGRSAGLIRSVWSAYRNQTPIELSMLTHEPGSAWDITRKLFGDSDTPVIPNAWIKEEFLARKQHGGHLG